MESLHGMNGNQNQDNLEFHPRKIHDFPPNLTYAMKLDCIANIVPI
jgi:hypothetical protein